MKKLSALVGVIALGFGLQANAALYNAVSLENQNANSGGFSLLDNFSADVVDINGPVFAIPNPTYTITVFLAPPPNPPFIDLGVTADAWTIDGIQNLVIPTNHVCEDTGEGFLSTCAVEEGEIPSFTQSGDAFVDQIIGGPGSEEIVVLWCDNSSGCFDETAGEGSTYRLTLQVVPVPAAVWLFGSALGMLGWIRRRAAA
jgi:hypothetical protein